MTLTHPVYPLVPRAAEKRQENKTIVQADTAAKGGRVGGIEEKKQDKTKNP